MSKIRNAIGLAGVAALGAYWLYGEEGRRRRERVRGWALRFKGEALEGLERAKDVNRDTCARVVDQVARRYENLKRVNKRELRELANDLKGSWGRMKRELSERP